MSCKWMSEWINEWMGKDQPTSPSHLYLGRNAEIARSINEASSISESILELFSLFQNFNIWLRSKTKITDSAG